MDTFQCSVPGPKIEIIIDRAFRMQIFRQMPPRTAGLQNIEQRIHDLAHIDFASASASLGRRDKVFDEDSFLIGEIVRVMKPPAVVLPPVFCCPHPLPP